MTRMVIPEGVTRIADNAFNGCYQLQSVEIPDSVTSIGKYAFYNCSSLKSITIPDGVTAIEEYTFCNCGLENIVIPNNVNVIGAHAFERCYDIKSITLPIELKRIEENAFECTGIEDIRLPNGLEYIGESAFDNCESLTSITIPDSVTYLGDRAFLFCNDLTRVQLGRGISQIRGGTFCDCHFLQDITIPDNINSIGPLAFGNCCNNLKNIKLPNALIDIGDDAFRGCYNLEELVIPKTVKHIGDAAFFDCSRLSSVKLPENIESIGDHAFVNCTSLESITIPSNVKEIGDELFSGCEGTCVVISKSLNVIDYCKKHNYKHFYSNAPSVQKLSSYNGSDFRIFVEKRENASGYQIKYATNKEMAGAKSVILKGADNSSKVISGLKNGNVYYIKVQAFQKIGDKTYWTSWSPVSSIKITQTPYPTNVSKLSTFIGSHIKVDWTKTAGASGYHIKYADNSSMTNAKEVMVKGNSTFSKTFTGLKNGKTYYVKIQTYRTVSGKTYWSSWSPAKSIKVDQTPYGSSIKKLTRESSTKMKVTWDKAPSASGYHIQYYWNDNNNNRVTKDIFINDNGTLSKTFTGMKKYTPIYVRIQTFKKISGKTYWSPWSKAKDIFLY